MRTFSHSKPIWINNRLGIDEHAQFMVEYAYNSGKVDIYICADSDYILYINGKVVSFGQYHSYPDELYYDRIKIDGYLNKGNNIIAIEVWHYGTSCFVHADAKSGVIFEIKNNGKVVVESSSNILSRKSPTYLSGNKKIITAQLGFSYIYDSTKEDEWVNGAGNGFTKSVELDVKTNYKYRPIKKLKKESKVYGELIKKQEKLLYDIGTETVGYPFIKLVAEENTMVTVAFGEHIVDGWVRKTFDNGRDFSFNYIAKKGINDFVGYFRRLGCRYLEISADKKIEIIDIGLIPVNYPLKERKVTFNDKIREKIYQVSLHTLKCCMHEHFEDCPWREQALYTMDSRNQMLCSYYAFENPKRYIRSNLDLIAKGIKDNGQLDICFPSNDKMYIPSFSLHFFTQVKEYLLYTGDKKTVKKYLSVLKKIIDSFLKNARDGIICIPDDENAWNFYEWKENYIICTDETDLIINCLFSIALKNYEIILEILHEENCYGEIVEKLNQKISTKFFDAERKIFRTWENKQQYSMLANALAVLADIPKSDSKEVISLLLGKYEDVVQTTLSMKCFNYDALLKIDKEKYKEYILTAIDKDYKYMLDNGATSFWETLEGEKDFGGHASLCHGWSAMPIYYYNVLL